MIVDDLRRVSRAFRELTRGAQVARVPYEVCPYTDEPDGRWGLWWKEWNVELNALVPRAAGGEISCEWWRPPFPRLIIASQRPENGVMFANSMPPVRIGDDEQTAAATGWNAMVGLIYLRPDGLVGAACNVHVIEKRGSLGVNLPTMAENYTRLQEFLTGVRPDALTHATAVASVQRLADGNPDEVKLDLSNMLCTFAMTMALWSCKNVRTVERAATRQLRRAAERSGHPLVSWHELEITPRESKRQGAAGDGEPLALHWVRGHFKDYRENGLFGRARGMYWWSPHLAGQADRVALKDYSMAPGRDLTAARPGPAVLTPEGTPTGRG